MTEVSASARPRVVLLMGPTAAGKTDAAMRLAEELPCEIVSVDSALVYRGLDIGTGKPSRLQRERIAHHLIDIRDPSDAYSAGQFVSDAALAIQDILARGKWPVLVGGTMLYFRALTRGLAELPQADPEIRRRLDERAAQVGWPALHAELAQQDPYAAQRIQPHDAQRIQRALEVIELTGERLSALQQRTRPALLDGKYFRCIWNPSDRDALYERIAQRFLAMLGAGFVDEVASLMARPELHRDLPALRAVGYRQICGHVAGEYSLAEAQRLGILATRHLARRQLIWLRAEPDAEWFDSLRSDAYQHLRQRVMTFFAKCEQQNG